MDALSEFMHDLQRHGLGRGHFLGLLNVLIGRSVTTSDGTVISQGLTWRALAGRLKKVRWDKDSVRELDLDPDSLPPRDRQRYWYTAIASAELASTKANEAGDRLASALRAVGYVVGPAPGK